MRKPKVIIVEDDQKFSDPFIKLLKREADVRHFETIEAFAEHFDGYDSRFDEEEIERDHIEDYSLVILDYQFPRYNALKKDAMTFLREDLKFRGKAILWTKETDIPEFFAKQFDAVSPKVTMTLSEVYQCIEEQKV